MTAAVKPRPRRRPTKSARPQQSTPLATDGDVANYLDAKLTRLIAGLDTTTRESRVAATANDPLAFAIVYLWRHMIMTDTRQITMGLMHWDWRTLALKLMSHKPYRTSLVAPRDSGKSTWWFLIIPLWAAAHGHSRFIAAFADSGTQAETHLMSFKHELDTNELLREDFPDLCRAAKRPSSGGNVADNSGLMVCANGFAFKASGIDASNLGLKVNEMRPDFIIFDDIEPDESSYSVYQAKKRLTTVQDAVLPMNTKARVVFTGTVTMAGGITHQLVQSVTSAEGVAAEWITDEKIQVHYYPPILKGADGESEASIWPAKWPNAYLQGIKHTRSFAKNFKNLPIATDGDYWTAADFMYGIPAPITHTLLSVDGAVTTKKTSDFTGLAVISYKPPVHTRPDGPSVMQTGVPMTREQMGLPAVIVQEALEVKLKGEFLREKALTLIEDSAETDHPIRLIYIESNQGGDLWLLLFHDMPVPVEFYHSKIKKEVRAAKTLNHYQRERVWHAKEHPALEEQMMGYPDVLHDDMIDAVGAGVAYYARKAHASRRPAQRSKSVSYIR